MMKTNKTKFKFFGLFAAILVFAAFGANHFSIGAQTNNSNARPSATPPKPTPTPVENNDQNGEDEVLVVDSDLVNLNVRVVDRMGRSIGDLKNSDFKVFEDGVEQKIEFISKAEVPVEYGLLIDNSLSLRPQFEKILEASKIIVGANQPDDTTFVIRFVSSDKIDIKQEATKNREDLDYAIDNLYLEGGQTAVIDAVILGAEESAKAARPQKRDEEKVRRALILITDGEDRASYYKEEQLFEQLREADIQIYPIGFVNDLSKEGGFIKKSPRAKAMKLLERMATETGGKAYFPTSVAELNDIAKSIANELRTQYQISYAPTNTARDGSFRQIRVTVADDAKRNKRIPVTRNGRTARKN